MQDQPCHVNILLAQNAHSPRARSSELLCQRARNIIDVVQATRHNAPRDVWIVGGRFSRCCVVRGFGFCDLNSPDMVQRACIFRRAIVIKFVRIGTSGTHQNTDTNLPTIVMKLRQRFFEVALVFPFNICPWRYCWWVQRMSDLDGVIGYCVLDESKIGTAGDHNDKGYA
jgi:hypothetical protein